MKRQQKNNWKNVLLSRFTHQERKRPRTRTTLRLESLERRQVLSGVPWVPTGMAEAPSAETAASVPAAEVAAAADAAAAKVPGKGSPEVMKATVTPDVVPATPPADGERLDTDPVGVNEGNNRADDGLDGGAFDTLPDAEMFRELQELQRLMKDLQEAFQFPEVGGGLPGGSDPSVDVDGIEQRVFGDEASVEDILFGRQGPRWNGTGTGVDSFDMNNTESGGYPSGERGPSGQAAPNISPSETSIDDFSEYGGDTIETTTAQMDVVPFVVFVIPPSVVSVPVAAAASAVWLIVTDIFTTTTSECDQPNPEGDDDGGPIKGDSNGTLDWLAGRSPRSRNPATAPRIGKLDVLGQPDSEEGRYPAAAHDRFARMRDDIDPAMMSSGADGGGSGGDSEGCPIGPDPDDPDSPIGPSGPSPVE